MKKKVEPKVTKTIKPKTAPAKRAADKRAEKREEQSEKSMNKIMAEVEPKVAKTAKPRKKPVKKMVDELVDASGLTLAKLVAQGMFEKKAENIKILDMRGLKGASSDFFVISHAVSDKQVEAIADSAEDEVHKLTGEWPRHREGYENLEWILLDYFDVVAHIFQEEKRDFYAIEELWGDAKEIPFKGK